MMMIIIINTITRYFMLIYASVTIFDMANRLSETISGKEMGDADR